MRLEQKNNNSQQVKRLWKDCFHDTSDYMEFYFDYKSRDNVVLGLEEDGELVSMVQLNPYELSVNQHHVHSYYIVGVATDERYRKRGLMRKLLRESMELMYQEKVPFTYLMPAKEAIYLPFDFRIVTTQRRKSIPLYHWSDKKKSSYQAAGLHTHESTPAVKIQRITTSENDLHRELADYANETMNKQEQIYTVRDTYYYERAIAELEACGGALLAVCVQGVLKGYASFAVEMDKVEIWEFFCEPDWESFLVDSVMEFVMQRDSKDVYEEVEPSTAPPIMARIIHIEEFLKLIRAEETLELVIEVKDPLIKENCGTYRCNFGKNESKICKVSEVSCLRPDLSGTIDAWTQFFFGRLEEKQVRDFIQSDVPSVMEKLKVLGLFRDVYLNEIV